MTEGSSEHTRGRRTADEGVAGRGVRVRIAVTALVLVIQLFPLLARELAIVLFEALRGPRRPRRMTAKGGGGLTPAPAPQGASSPGLAPGLGPVQPASIPPLG